MEKDPQLIKTILTLLIKNKGDCLHLSMSEMGGCASCPLSKYSTRIKSGRWECAAKHYTRYNWIQFTESIAYEKAVKMYIKLYGKDALFEVLL